MGNFASIYYFSSFLRVSYSAGFNLYPLSRDCMPSFLLEMQVSRCLLNFDKLYEVPKISRSNALGYAIADLGVSSFSACWCLR